MAGRSGCAALLHTATFAPRNLSRIAKASGRASDPHMFRIASGVLAVGAAAAIVSAQSMKLAIRSELAPTGRLRAGINYNNPLVAAPLPSAGWRPGDARLVAHHRAFSSFNQISASMRRNWTS